MVKEYLENMKQEFIDRRGLINEQISSFENQLKENEKFIQILEDTTDPNYEVFSPREINSFNRKKIVELKEEQKTVWDHLTNLRDELGEVEYRIAEITSVIRVAREDISDSVEETDYYDTRIALLKTVEAERQRIARDLHDSTTQNLTALVHKTELCTKLLDTDPLRCKLELFSIGKSLRDIIEDMRGLIYDLRPMSFDDIGFEVTIERTLDKFSQSNNIQCSYYLEGEPYAIDSVVQITLLRVIQESCNNALKHAQATKIDVILCYQENRIILTIKDDGKGFDASTLPKNIRDDNSGFGLSMMKERVYLLSGKISIKSNPGDGCSIIVTIPKSKEDK